MPNDTSEKQRNHVARRLKLGQCRCCSSLAVTQSYCGRHLLKERARQIRKRKIMVVNMRCVACYAALDIDADSGHRKCINCREGIHGPVTRRITIKRRINHATVFS